MRFSIILPVRNGGEYVKQCIRSLLSQTYNSYNIIVLDNKSTDGTAEWILSLNNEKVVYYRSGKDLSIEENWGRIKDVSKNEFMTMIGHDDLLDENYLATMDSLISAFPGRGLYQAHFRFIDAAGKITGKCKPMDEEYTTPAFLEALLTSAIDTMGTGYMMRSSDYDSTGGMPPFPNLLFADHSLWLSMASGGVAVAKEECFSFRLHQSTSKMSNMPRYFSAFCLFMEFLQQYRKKDAGIDLALKRSIDKFILYYGRSFTHRLLKTPVDQRQGLGVAVLIDKCDNYWNSLSGSGGKKLSKHLDIRICRLIDNNKVLLKLYLQARKLF
jgi:glycosyltransferase involved in cell wall biosynthesis